MTEAPASLGAQRLVARYQAVSLSGRYDTFQTVSELSDLCDAIHAELPPHRMVVNDALKDFFSTIADNFDELALAMISWPQLDAVVLEAVSYVAKGTHVADAARISTAVTSARIRWSGR